MKRRLWKFVKVAGTALLAGLLVAGGFALGVISTGEALARGIIKAPGLAGLVPA